MNSITTFKTNSDKTIFSGSIFDQRHKVYRTVWVFPKQQRPVGLTGYLDLHDNMYMSQYWMLKWTYKMMTLITDRKNNVNIEIKTTNALALISNKHPQNLFTLYIQYEWLPEDNVQYKSLYISSSRPQCVIPTAKNNKMTSAYSI